MIERMGEEIWAGVRRGAGELAVSFVAALFLFGGSLVATLLLWGAVYMVSCWISPNRTCARCGGTKKPRRGDGRGNWSDKPCGWCQMTGERRRWGARLLGRGRPDRHDVDAS